MSKFIGRISLLIAIIFLSGCKLDVSTDGRGQVTSKSGLINCGTSGSQCQVDYEKFSDLGSSYTEKLYAQADPGYEFSGWSGDCSGSGECSIKINKLTGDKSVTAKFTEVDLSDSKEITEFKFTVADNPSLPSDISGVINELNKTIKVSVPTSTDLHSLVASFSSSAQEVTVNGIPQDSNSTVNDFSSTVYYTAVAEDGTSARYLVTVLAVSFEANEIIDFRFPKDVNNGFFQDAVGVIDEAAHTVHVEVAQNTDLSSLVAAFEITGQEATVNGQEQQSGITANNYLSAVTYSVIAGNQLVQTYTVTVEESSCLGKTWAGDYIISSQSDIDALAGYTAVSGDLIVGGSGNPVTSLVNLEGLECLDTVKNLDVISNPDLLTLDGLDGLTTVEQDVTIQSNGSLTRIDGLSALTTVEDLLVSRNNVLENITGLEGLSSVVELRLDTLPLVASIEPIKDIEIQTKLTVQSLPSLTSLPAFSKLSNFTGSVSILGNNELTSLVGLEGITELNYLDLGANNKLTNLLGINNLSAVQLISVYDNAGLVDLQGLEKVTSLVDLVIMGNSDLENLEGLNGLETVTGDVTIEDNSSLVAIDDLSNLSQFSGKLTVKDNPVLSSLSGLENLSSNLSSLSIENNDGLIGLEGLNNVPSASNLVIKNNDGLETLQGLNGLSVAADFSIDSNMGLVSLLGLDSLANITGDLAVLNNDDLLNLEGLNNLTDVKGDFDIERNNKLLSVEGLNNLQKSGATSIRLNNALFDLDALTNLTQVTGSFVVFGNNNLENLAGLKNLSSIGTSTSHDLDIRGGFLDSVSLTGLTSISGDVYISGSTITDLDLPQLCNVGQNFKVTSNSGLCSTKADALRDQVMACDGLSSVVDVTGNQTCN